MRSICLTPTLYDTTSLGRERTAALETVCQSAAVANSSLSVYSWLVPLSWTCVTTQTDLIWRGFWRVWDLPPVLVLLTLQLLTEGLSLGRCCRIETQYVYVWTLCCGGWRLFADVSRLCFLANVSGCCLLLGLQCSWRKERLSVAASCHFLWFSFT